MKKNFFLEKYFFEMLFAGVSILTLLLALRGAVFYADIASFGVILFAVILQVIFGSLTIRASTQNSVLRQPINVWLLYFAAFIPTVFCASYLSRNLAGEIATIVVLLSNSIALRIYLLSVEKSPTLLQNDVDEKTDNKPKPLIQKYGHAFDVLCEVDGKMVRLPFEKRNGNLIGIFPFVGTGEYIELAEYPNKTHIDVDVDCTRLLDEHFCAQIARIKDRLNDRLKQLNSPILEGKYLADNTYMRGAGWIVGFAAGKDGISSYYYGGNTPAKLRYMGVFENTCEV